MWLLLYFRCQYFLAFFLYNIIQNSMPFLHLLKVCSWNLPFNHVPSARFCLSDLHPSHQTVSIDKSFISQTASIGNSIPPSVRHNSSLSSFKFHVLSNLFHSLNFMYALMNMEPNPLKVRELKFLLKLMIHKN